MALATEVARELFLYGPAGGRRVTAVGELSRLSGASERAIREHLEGWKRESEELAANTCELGFRLTLSASALEAHRGDVGLLRAEIDRLGRKLKSLAVTDEAYPAVQRAFLAAERRWAQVSGIEAMMAAAGARLKEVERLRARDEVRRAALEAEREERPVGPGRQGMNDPVFAAAGH